MPGKGTRGKILNTLHHRAVSPPNPSDTLDLEAAEEVRAQRAASALLEYDGNVDLAYRRIVPEADTLPSPTRRKLAKAYFSNVRIHEILRHDLSDLEANRKELQARVVEIALRSPDDETVIRAFQTIARVAGWIAPTKVDVTQKNMNIHTILEDPMAVKEALGYFDHEPGDAKALTSEDVIAPKNVSPEK